MTLDGKVLKTLPLNDILIAHQIPAAMSRYILELNKQEKELQRGSGLWLSTPSGSTGGILSAGGKIMKEGSRRIQYLPRELYYKSGQSYKLKGAMVRNPLIIQSKMREGMIYIDGSHKKIAFSFGSVLRVEKSPHDLRLISNES
ncbi:MAG: NAD(+)/NADH kinase [Lentisphaeria bacterium]|nr:NAD(+)/NADH kinase [Lentisphaeria bacterium]